MARAITSRSCRSDTGSPDDRSFSTSGPKIAFSSSALLVLSPFSKAFAASSGVAKRVRSGAGAGAHAGSRNSIRPRTAVRMR